MRVTRRLPGNSLAWTAVLLFALAGCGDPADPSSGSDAPASATTIPVAVEEVLARDSIKLTDSSFDSGVSSAEVLKAFSREYDPGMFERQPLVYAAEVVSSDESRLKPGTLVRVVHVAEVPQEVTPPSPEPGGEEATPFVIETDMFAFFSAETGVHLATVYIGAPA